VRRFAFMLLMAVLTTAACNGKKQQKSQDNKGNGSGTAAEKATGAGAQGQHVNKEMLERPEVRDQTPPGIASGGGTEAPRPGAPPPEPPPGPQDKNKKGSVSYGNPAGTKPQSNKAPQ
jgi:hypothetical protein